MDLKTISTLQKAPSPSLLADLNAQAYEMETKLGLAHLPPKFNHGRAAKYVMDLKVLYEASSGAPKPAGAAQTDAAIKDGLAAIARLDALVARIQQIKTAKGDTSDTITASDWAAAGLPSAAPATPVTAIVSNLPVAPQLNPELLNCPLLAKLETIQAKGDLLEVSRFRSENWEGLMRECEKLTLAGKMKSGPTPERLARMAQQQ